MPTRAYESKYFFCFFSCEFRTFVVCMAVGEFAERKQSKESLRTLLHMSSAESGNGEGWDFLREFQS